MSRQDPLHHFDSFGDLLRHLRRRARLTQRDLGLAVGYSEAQITRLETGTRLPDVNLVKGLFFEALDLANEPQTAKRLIELAQQARLGAHSQLKLDEGPKTNLPANLTSFIGRVEDVNSIRNLLRDSRLVTITGSGGSGKTRIAQQVGRSLIEKYPAGAWWVDLTTIDDASLVIDAIARGLGILTTKHATLPIILEFLSERHLLLILDNCEHVIVPCAGVVEALLRNCPNLYILTTSREAMRVPGEIAWRVPEMSKDEVIELFADRARMVQPGFVLDPRSTAVVSQMCQQLDSMPLAIELAAARLSSMTLNEIALRLDDRFRLLTGGMRTVVQRHQALRLTMDWSYWLLDEREQAVFRRVCVFANGFTLDEAEAMCADGELIVTADVMNLIQQLVAKSLLIADIRVAESRFRMLESIRQYGTEKLAATDEYAQVRSRHAACYARMCLETIEHLRSWDCRAWMDKLEQSMGNVRIALAWAIETRNTHWAAQIAYGMTEGPWFWHGYSDEGLEWIDHALLNPPAMDMDDYMAGLVCGGWLCLHKADEKGAHRLLSQAVLLCDQTHDLQLKLYALAGVALITPDYTAAWPLNERAIAMARAAGNPWSLAYATLTAGGRAADAQDSDLARALSADAAAQYEKLGDQRMLLMALKQLGEVEFGLRETVCAGELFQRARNIATELDLPVERADMSFHLARVFMQGEEIESARSELLSVIHIFRRMGNIERMLQCMMMVAVLAEKDGNTLLAVRLLSGMEAIRSRQQGLPYQHSVYDEASLRQVNHLRDIVDPIQYEHAWNKGMTMTLDGAIEALLEIEGSNTQNAGNIDYVI